MTSARGAVEAETRCANIPLFFLKKNRKPSFPW